MSGNADDRTPTPQAMTEQIGISLFRLIPDGAAAVVYDVRALAPFFQETAHARMPTGETLPIRVPDEVSDIVERTRAAMYRPGAGTWYSARFTVTDAGSMDADFDYDNEPEWTRPVEPVWYAEDLEKFPRDEAAIPGWLRERLREADAAAQ